MEIAYGFDLSSLDGAAAAAESHGTYYCYEIGNGPTTTKMDPTAKATTITIDSNDGKMAGVQRIWQM